MLACALGIKQMNLDECEEIYKSLGKLVFAEPIPKDNEAATWREKIDQVYKSSSQNFRVVVHGSKVSLQSSPFFFLPLVYKVNFCYGIFVFSNQCCGI
jgi:hypothetical protein